jgi:hypothetical protein
MTYRRGHLREASPEFLPKPVDQTAIPHWTDVIVGYIIGPMSLIDICDQGGLETSTVN